MKTVAIIGGGISGLTCGYQLAKKGVAFKLFEQKSEIGGRVQDVVIDNTVVPLGARSLSVLDKSFLSLLEELGLSAKIKPSSIYKNRGIYKDGRMIRIATLPILFDFSIPFKTKMDLRRFRNFLSKLAKDSSMKIPEVSLKEYMLQNFSAGVLDDFVEPFVRSEFSNSSDNIPAASGLRRLLVVLFRGYELDGGLMSIAKALEKAISEQIIRNSKIVSVQTAVSGGGFDVATSTDKYRFDDVVCCAPIPELAKFLNGVTLPNVGYVPKTVYIIRGKSKFPNVTSILVGDPKLNIDFIFRYGPLFQVATPGGEPDYSPFFDGVEVLKTQNWEFGASRMGRPGNRPPGNAGAKPPDAKGPPSPQFETNVEHLYLAGDFVVGGGVGSAVKAGMEMAAKLSVS